MTTRPLTPADWPQVEALFGANGACGGCWCMWWRVERGGKLWESVKGERNRASLKELIESGRVHAVLAFDDGGRPVGWCSFGPRRTFPRLETVKALRREFDDGTWSVVCFYIHPKWRGKGVGSAMLEAATRRAFELGAREIEGYPAVPQKGTIPGAFAWTGVPAMFASAGYQELHRPAASRPIFIKRTRS